MNEVTDGGKAEPPQAAVSGQSVAH
jgi:hypothetical protein